MVEKLIFEYCRTDGSSKLIDLELRDKKYILKVASGKNGLYLDNNFTFYKCEAKFLTALMEQIQHLKIYSWKRYYPVTYKPSNRLLGSDSGTWSLHYKEIKKKVFRHVNGYGEYPTQWSQFLLLLDVMVPNSNLQQWINQDIIS